MDHHCGLLHTTYDFFQVVETGEDALSSMEKPYDWPKPI